MELRCSSSTLAISSSCDTRQHVFKRHTSPRGITHEAFTTGVTTLSHAMNEQQYLFSLEWCAPLPQNAHQLLLGEGLEVEQRVQLCSRPFGACDCTMYTLYVYQRAFTMWGVPVMASAVVPCL